MKAKQCSYEGCNNPAFSKGRCKYHPLDKKAKMAANKALKRTPLKKISDKRKKQVAAYSVLREQFLKDNPNCAVFPHLKATEIHHTHHRENERLNDTRYWLAVSRRGHQYIHNNPEESYAKKWLIKG